MPAGARKAGWEKLPGSPGGTPHIWRERGVAPKQSGLRSLPQAVLCFAGTEVMMSTGFVF